MQFCKVVKGYESNGYTPIHCGQEATEHRSQYISSAQNISTSAVNTTAQDVNLHYCPECVKSFDTDQVRLRHKKGDLT